MNVLFNWIHLTDSTAKNRFNANLTSNVLEMACYKVQTI